ncbi:MAG: hypothetical protein KBG15_21990 [Kofleriaceae bacterium]|nr:hypothetical protein [Kofleriaceae bacterium]
MSNDNSTNPGASDELTDDEIGILSDFHDNALPVDKIKEVAALIAQDARWRAASEEFVATKQALSGLQKARAPVSFAEDLTNTIHRRSGGAFFGRRAFGDRVPFGVLLVIGIILIVGVAIMLWSSQTGSLSSRRTNTPAEPTGADQLPRP